MNLGPLYDKIRRALAHIIVVQDGEQISEGSGFCFLPTGEILTAAHVVAGGYPLRKGEVDDPTRRIVVRFVHNASISKPILYKPAVCPIQFEFKGVGIKPLQIDIALLVPLEPQNGVEHLKASTHPAILGEQMYFGGYSDEVDFPFLFDRNLDSTVEGVEKFRQEYPYGIRTIMAGPIIKSGIVGNTIMGIAKVGQRDINVTAFYLDNQIHSGASGGPIVDSKGDARGIILRRQITTADQDDGTRLKIPSGSTYGVSLDILKALAPA